MGIARNSRPGSSTGLRRAGKPFRLRGRIDWPIPYPLADEARADGARDEKFQVPHTTMQTGIIAGTASNIVPRDCEFQFDMRYLPGSDPSAFAARIQRYAADSLLPELRRVSKDADIRLELLAEAPDLNTPDVDRLAYLGMRLTGNMNPGRVGFATDGGHFHRAGVPTIVIGPGLIDQAHKPNEFNELEQIAQCDRFLARLCDHMIAK